MDDLFTRSIAEIFMALAIAYRRISEGGLTAPVLPLKISETTWPTLRGPAVLVSAVYFIVLRVDCRVNPALLIPPGAIHARRVEDQLCAAIR